MAKKTLEVLLKEVAVLDPGMWENDAGPAGWYAVMTEDFGIVAYAMSETVALNIRLAIINSMLNPITPETIVE